MIVMPAVLGVIAEHQAGCAYRSLTLALYFGVVLSVLPSEAVAL